MTIADRCATMTRYQFSHHIANREPDQQQKKAVSIHSGPLTMLKAIIRPAAFLQRSAIASSPNERQRPTGGQARQRPVIALQRLLGFLAQDGLGGTPSYFWIAAAHSWCRSWVNSRRFAHIVSAAALPQQPDPPTEDGWARRAPHVTAGPLILPRKFHIRPPADARHR
jgi:hypothetical protein